jgi:hypothetical protein
MYYVSIMETQYLEFRETSFMDLSTRKFMTHDITNMLKDYKGPLVLQRQSDRVRCAYAINSNKVITVYIPTKQGVMLIIKCNDINYHSIASYRKGEKGKWELLR